MTEHTEREVTGTERADGAGRGRRRALPMSVEQRREMIVRTALPLVAERGAAVTTQQIARAAGIGEATIFRAFPDKDALIDACVATAVRPDHVLAEIAAIPLDAPLADRLTEAAGTLRAHLQRIGTVMAALHASGRTGRAGAAGHAGHAGRGRPEADPGRRTGLGRQESMTATRDAVADLLEPDRGSLRMPADTLAGIFLGLLLASHRPLPSGGEPASIEELVDVFLHGALDRAA